MSRSADSMRSSAAISVENRPFMPTTSSSPPRAEGTVREAGTGEASDSSVGQSPASCSTNVVAATCWPTSAERGTMTPPPEPVVAGPLGGLRIVVTRPRDQAASLVDALEAQGAEAVLVPVIEITEPLDGGVGLRTALRVLRDGDWVAVTSPNGAATVADALGERPLADGVRVAVVGPGTRDRAESLGLPVDLVPADAIAEGLAAAFPAPPIAGGRVVLARAEVARETLPIHLRMMG